MGCLLNNKSICLIILFLSLSYKGQAQKHDYIWMNGYDAEWGGEFGNFQIDFKSDPVSVFDIDYQNSQLDGQVTSFSDSIGNLVAVTNGCQFYDKYGNAIPGSDSLNPGKLSYLFCENGAYPFTFDMILLPIEDKLVAFHFGIRDDNKFTLTRWPTYKTVLKINSEIPKVEDKNVKINTFHGESPAACKHGNGKNWWVISPQKDANNYYIHFLNDNCVFVWKIQSIGYEYSFEKCNADGVQSFSPDGSIFVRYNNTCGLSFFDFDRCKGELSNERQIILPEVFPPGAATVFSPDSRFCYFNSSRVIMQVDMEEEILHADTVAIVDTFPAPFGAGFYLMQLAPDGRVYICTGSSTKAWHVIEYPDKKGKDCWVRPNALEFPYWSYHAIPNIPNYRLGALAGSPCDTLGLSSTVFPETSTLAHRVYPNPVGDAFMLELDEGTQHSDPWELIVMDVAGRVVTQGVIPPYAYLHRVETASWHPGLYPYVLRNHAGQILASGKLVKNP